MDIWDKRFLDLAKLISTYSKDPSTKVGAVIVDPKKRVVSLGFNGFSSKTEDTDERLNNRDLKYKIVIHAELNAIIFAKRDLSNCSMFVYPFMPCSNCSSSLIQSGITRVIAPVNNNPRWVDSFSLSKELLEEAGVKLDLYDIEI